MAVQEQSSQKWKSLCHNFEWSEWTINLIYADQKPIPTNQQINNQPQRSDKQTAD